MSEPTVALFPAWKQAVRDFLAEFTYGQLVPLEWLEGHFGMPSHQAAQRMTAAQYRERQFEWLANVEAFKTELLEDHQIMLQSVRGKGYRWVPPQEQTKAASAEFERDVRKAFKATGQRLRHVRLGELTDDQRRENSDTIAKISQLRGTVRKQLR